jgi:phage gpG-like protein
MTAPSKFFTTLDITLPDDLTRAEKKEVLKQVADYTIVAMLDLIGDGVSPVTGDAWKDLKGGGTSTLEDEGDLLDSLKFKIVDGEVQIGFFEKLQAAKAFGHTTGMEGHPWLEGKTPERKIIPIDSEGEEFAEEIKEGIEKILEEFLDGR